MMNFRVAVGCTILLSLARLGCAGQVVLNGANVIGGSGAYGGDWSSGQFNAREIVDQQTGAVTDSFGATYWLNPDNGPANAYIVIDLGAAYQITSLELFNTHNDGFNDRGTGSFSFEASNSVTNLGTAGFDLSSGTGVTILASTLLPAHTPDPIPGQTFTVSDPGTYRYIKFEPHSVAVGGNSCCGANNYGLNELRVFSDPVATPEPASTELVCFVVIASIAIRRRSRSIS